jgi:hypothetical protein
LIHYSSFLSVAFTAVSLDVGDRLGADRVALDSVSKTPWMGNFYDIRRNQFVMNDAKKYIFEKNLWGALRKGNIFKMAGMCTPS